MILLPLTVEAVGHVLFNLRDVDRRELEATCWRFDSELLARATCTARLGFIALTDASPLIIAKGQIDRLFDTLADAIRDHYKPHGPSDSVPTAPLSICLALADKLEIVYFLEATSRVEPANAVLGETAERRAAAGADGQLRARRPLGGVLST